MKTLAERPATKVILNALVRADDKSLWVRERNFLECIREHSLIVRGVPLSTSSLKKELNSLIFKGYVDRIRYSPTGERDEDGRAKLNRLAVEDYRDYYTSLNEYWQYVLVERPELRSAPYIVS